MEYHTEVGCCDTCTHAEVKETHSPCAACIDAYNHTKKSPYWNPKSTDPVDHPEHYTAGHIECIDAIQSALTEEEFRGYCKGNILKYVWRERHKAGVESLEKAEWYLNRLIQEPK